MSRTTISVNAMAKACGMSVPQFLATTDLDEKFDDSTRKDAIKSIKGRRDEKGYQLRMRNAVWLLIRFYLVETKRKKRHAAG